MIMISTIGSSATQIDQTYTNVSATQTVNSEVEETDQSAQETSNSDNISLSTRAQKMSAIDNEFFNGKPITSLDIQQLINRVHEYGLISDTEFEALGGSETETSTTNPVSLTESLESYIVELQKSLDTLENTQMFSEVTIDEFQKALDSTKSILNDVEKAKKTSDFKLTLAENKQTLSQVLESEEFDALSMDDKVTVHDSIKALTIIDKISPDQLTNASVNQYIGVANL